MQRTLRIPDDDRVYPLPPGLGLFPILAVAPFADRVPDWWHSTDLMVPVYQREALWIGFDGPAWRPNAVKVGIGRINAVSGQAWDPALHDDPQDYLVCPLQPWLDGINAGENFIRQFVAMPLGQGYTVEAQVTGEERFGGIQIIVYEPRPGRFPDKPPQQPRARPEVMAAPATAAFGEMGLGAGGRMKQKIYPDPQGIDAWDQNNFASVFVHLVNSTEYRELTGIEPPPTPISAQTYSEYGLPWFDLYDEALADVESPAILTKVRSVTDLDREKEVAGPDDLSIEIDDSQIKKL